MRFFCYHAKDVSTTSHVLCVCLAAALGNSIATDSRAVSSADQTACIAPNEFIVLDPASVGYDSNNQTALGAYERVSPDGRFVLRSFSGVQLGAVSLIELPPPTTPTRTTPTRYSQVKVYKTPLSNEAFPVQGTWRYLVDTNGDHYAFSSVLRNQNKAQALFSGGMTGFYAAAAELPAPLTDGQNNQQNNKQNSPPSQVLIRSLSWPNASDSSDAQGQGTLTIRTLRIDLKTQKPVADTGRVNVCTNRLREDGAMYSLPMISVDGTEFAALPQNPPKPPAGGPPAPLMRIFGFGPNGTGCEPRAQFSFDSGKVIFGFPGSITTDTAEKARTNNGADVAYEYRAQVYWYSREHGRAFNLEPYSANPDVQQFASAFPGLTRDGRVIYAATWRDCSALKNTIPGQAQQSSLTCPTTAGYVISDPYQSSDYKNWLAQSKTTARRQCITHGDVARERQAFTDFHGLLP